MTVEKIITAFSELKKINVCYDINSKDIDKCIENISIDKVCMPIIGKFSSGKSALCNGILGYRKILKEDITPETAIPTEIVYADYNKVVTYTKNDNEETAEEISAIEYAEKEFSSKDTSRIRLFLNNSFLKEIKDVIIVDMPGFESGIELHNTAINNYIDILRL